MAAVDIITDLAEDLTERNTTSAAYQRYYDGDHPLPWIHKKVAARYNRLMRQAITNFPLLVVDSVKNRLRVQGFRLDEADADQFVWTDVWQRNNLDIYSGMVHQQALVTGVSYVSVWPDDLGRPRIRGESCTEVYHESEPDDPMVVRYALKVWADVYAKTWYARVFEPGTVTFLSAPYRGMDMDSITRPVFSEFARTAKWDVDEVVDNPFGETVPIVPFLNRPRMDGTGLGEFADIIPLFDRVNTLTADLLLAAELAAFKIRWATGLEIPRDTDGNPVEPYDVALDRLWISEDPETRYGSFDATPLDPYASAIDQAIHQIAAASSTPPTLLTGKITNLSAESLKAMETGLVMKVKSRMQAYGEAWAQVVRLGLAAYGDSRSDMAEIETIWVDPENVSEAQRVDALVKLSSIGLPWRAVMERWGATPQEIDRWDQMRADDVFARMMADAATATPAMDNGGPSIAQTTPQQDPEDVPAQ